VLLNWSSAEDTSVDYTSHLFGLVLVNWSTSVGKVGHAYIHSLGLDLLTYRQKSVNTNYI